MTRLLLVLMTLAAAACAPSSVPRASTSADHALQSSPPTRTLIFIGGRVPENLGSKPVRDTRGPDQLPAAQFPGRGRRGGRSHDPLSLAPPLRRRGRSASQGFAAAAPPHSRNALYDCPI